MKKIFTSVVAVLAISMSANAETSLRDQIVGKYVGSEAGTEWLVNYGASYTWSFTEDNPVVIAAGEADDAVVIKNFFRNDNANISDLNATVVSSDADGYLGYINIPAQACGTVDYMTYGTFNAYIHAYYSSTAYLDQTPEGDIQMWITSDGVISSYATGWAVLMDWYGDGSAYYNGLVGYSENTLTKLEEEEEPVVDNSAANAELRNQLVGKYTGSESGYEYLIEYGATYTWDFTEEDPVELAAGEADDAIVIKNFFRNDNAHISDLNATVVSTGDEYEGYLGYINVPAQACGTVDYMTYGTFNAYIHAAYDSTSWLAQKPEGDIQLWITSDGVISTYATGWAVLMDWYGDGSAYYNGLLGYSDNTLTKLEEEEEEEPVDSAISPELRDQIVGKYTGQTYGYDYVVGNAAYYDLTFGDDLPAVEIAAGEGEADVTITNLFPSIDGMETTPLNGTVYTTDAYADYGIIGYIEVPVQSAGVLTSDYGEFELTFGKTDYSWNKDLTNASYFYIYEDGGVETDCYASLFYPYVYDDVEYTYWARFYYTYLTKEEEKSADAELRDELVGKYTGQTYGYDYVVGNAAYYNLTFNEDLPAVEIAAGEGEADVTITNLFPSVDGMVTTPLTGTVHLTDEYADYSIIGYIEVPVQSAGVWNSSYGDFDLTFGKTDYEWNKNLTDASYFYIYEDGGVETDCYASLFYPYVYDDVEYTYWARFYYTYLTKVDESGVETIVADQNANVEYYNLSGMKVNASNLSKGLYIKRQGNKVEKVIIK